MGVGRNSGAVGKAYVCNTYVVAIGVDSEAANRNVGLYRERVDQS